MSADIYVRKMVASDVPEVIEIDQALFGAKRFPTWPFSFQVYWREYNPDVRLVAETGQRLAGFIVGCFVVEEHDRSVLNLRHSGGSARPYRQVGWIDMIGVRPDNQGTGVGRKLVEAFCEQCSKANVDVRAVTIEEDQKLKHFLEAAGFKAREFAVYERNRGVAGDRTP